MGSTIAGDSKTKIPSGYCIHHDILSRLHSVYDLLLLVARFERTGAAKESRALGQGIAQRYEARAGKEIAGECTSHAG